MWLRRNHVSQETDLPRLTFWGNSGMRVAGDGILTLSGKQGKTEVSDRLIYIYYYIIYIIY